MRNDLAFGPRLATRTDSLTVCPALASRKK